MANVTIQVPLENDVIAIPKSELDVDTGDKITVVFDVKVKGTINISSSEDGVLVSFAKDDHTTPIIEDPPAPNS